MSIWDPRQKQNSETNQTASEVGDGGVGDKNHVPTAAADVCVREREARQSGAAPIKSYRYNKIILTLVEQWPKPVKKEERATS